MAKINYAEKSCAVLEVESVAGESAVTSAFASTPLKLLTPVSRGQSVWAYTSSFGGGFVAGDETRLELNIGNHARCFLGTQASTKIYRNPRQRACSHSTQATVGENALLVFAPDPVQPFTCSSYVQRQTFQLEAGAGLVLVDWFTSGRAARGERWAFDRFQSRNEVFIAGQRVFLDAILLNPANGFTASSHQTGRFNCFATMLVMGLSLKEFAEKLTQEISTRPVGRRDPLVASASAIPGGALLRIAGESVEEVGRALHHHLKFVAPLLGDDPWQRKW